MYYIDIKKRDTEKNKKLKKERRGTDHQKAKKIIKKEI